MHNETVGSLPFHPTATNPLTGLALQAIGRDRNGRLIWPVMGGSQPTGEPAPTPTPGPATPPAPAPTPASAPPAPPSPAPQPTAPQQPQQQPQQPAQNTVTVNEHGFPDNTPWRQMAPEHQAAYWQHQSRGWENKAKGMGDYEQLKEKAAQYDALAAASQTDQERAVAAATAAARQEAFNEAGGALVKGHFMALAANRIVDAEGNIDEERINGILDGLDLSKFHNNGVVDTAKVQALVAAFAPVAPAAAQAGQAQQANGQQQAGTAPAAPAQQTTWGTPLVSPQPMTQPGTVPAQGPDMGQGVFQTAQPSGLEAGRAAARAMFADQFAAKQQEPLTA